jgi:predicted transcriptional regulator
VDEVGVGRRRGFGLLEADVMTTLWAADRALTPGEVRQLLGTNLAYTTVMTILVRLHTKGLADRARRGRAFAYAPRQRAEDHAAQTMSDVLAGGADPEAVLSRFVERLAPEEEQLLRRLLDRGAGGTET